VVTATNDYNKEKQFRKLNAVKDSGNVQVNLLYFCDGVVQTYHRNQVLRGGEIVELPVKDLCVGDMMQLTAGDKVPADAVICSGNFTSLRVQRNLTMYRRLGRQLQ
jgi:magnesium-transporting ATPase (P-type)